MEINNFFVLHKKYSMKKLLAISCLSCLANNSIAQTSDTIVRIHGRDTITLVPPASKGKDILTLVDSLPRFYGNIKMYIDKKKQGHILSMNEKKTVKVRFIITETGMTKSPIVTNSPSRKVDSITKNIILGMPKWRPAIKDGKYISTPYMLEIAF